MKNKKLKKYNFQKANWVRLDRNRVGLDRNE